MGGQCKHKWLEVPAHLCDWCGELKTIRKGIEPSLVARTFNVWRCSDDCSYLYTTCDTLEEAVATCRDLDSAEPADRES